MAIAEAEIKSKVQPGMKITEGELMRLPKDGPENPTLAKYELVEGRLTEVPTSFSHDAICLNLILRLGPFMKGRGAGTTGQGGFRMRNGNIRVPDFSFILKARLPGGRVPEGFGTVAPDLCVEVISPSEKQADIRRKIHDYFDSGASLVWHIFPEAQQVVVFTSPTEPQFLDADDILTADDVLPGFSCRVGDIFLTEQF